MNTPSEEANATTTSKEGKPLEDLLDDFVRTAEEFKQGILELRELDEAERAMVKSFVRGGRKVFADFLNSLKSADK